MGIAVHDVVEAELSTEIHCGHSCNLSVAGMLTQDWIALDNTEILSTTG